MMNRRFFGLVDNRTHTTHIYEGNWGAMRMRNAGWKINFRCLLYNSRIFMFDFIFVAYFLVLFILSFPLFLVRVSCCVRFIFGVSFTCSNESVSGVCRVYVHRQIKIGASVCYIVSFLIFFHCCCCSSSSIHIQFFFAVLAVVFGVTVVARALSLSVVVHISLYNRFLWAEAHSLYILLVYIRFRINILLLLFLPLLFLFFARSLFVSRIMSVVDLSHIYTRAYIILNSDTTHTIYYQKIIFSLLYLSFGAFSPFQAVKRTHLYEALSHLLFANAFYGYDFSAKEFFSSLRRNAYTEQAKNDFIFFSGKKKIFKRENMINGWIFVEVFGSVIWIRSYSLWIGKERATEKNEENILS